MDGLPKLLAQTGLSFTVKRCESVIEGLMSCDAAAEIPHPISDKTLTLFRFLEHLRTSSNSQR